MEHLRYHSNIKKRNVVVIIPNTLIMSVITVADIKSNRLRKEPIYIYKIRVV